MESWKQIYVSKTGKGLIEFFDRLEADEPGKHNKYSRVVMHILDYSEGTGEHKKEASFFLEADDIAWLRANSRVGAAFSWQKSAFSSRKYRIITISHNPKNANGEVMRYPWKIKIENGTAQENANGLGFTNKNPESEVQFNFSDEGYFKCIHSVNRYVELWEDTFLCFSENGAQEL